MSFRIGESTCAESVTLVYCNLASSARLGLKPYLICVCYFCRIGGCFIAGMASTEGAFFLSSSELLESLELELSDEEDSDSD